MNANVTWQQISTATKMACGARDVRAAEDSLVFTVGANNPKKWIRVTLDPSDTYNVELIRMRPVTCEIVLLESAEGVYAESLSETIYRLVNK